MAMKSHTSTPKSKQKMWDICVIYVNLRSINVRIITRWRSWLRHCSRSRKVVGSIPDIESQEFFIDIILPAAL
jgi:hypothetical protein